MSPTHRRLGAGVALLLACLGSAARARADQPATLPPDTPAHFQPRTDSFDYVRREAMIPMRDGVRLHTVLIIPKGAVRAPIVLDRTPYNANELTNRAASIHRVEVLSKAFDVITASGYIVAVQDVRGKYGSEGEYVNARPLRGPLNPTAVDHATDAWDTVDWLVKNTPESNGRVAIMGASYDGMLALMAMTDPHPALKAAVPVNPVADTWMGDDDFHNGGYRQVYFDYYYAQDAQREGGEDLWRGTYDDYDAYLRAGSAGDFARAYGLDQFGFIKKLAAHPAYDAFWQGQALDRILATRPHKVAALFVQGQWDQEDIYGALAVWKATRKADAAGEDRLVIGPWRHAQTEGDGSSLGPLKFDGDTAAWFRRNVLQPFLDAHLKDGAPPLRLPAVTAYETGANAWRAYPSWPPPNETATPLYLREGGGLGFQPAPAGGGGYDAYVSNPAKPVPYRLRPIRPIYAQGSTWGQWLADDQRIFSDRPDVLAFETEPLTEPLRIAGSPQVDLTASTSGTDSDWVVKLIDVYPDEVASDPPLGGYQLMISADLFRGRYRKSFQRPAPIPANVPEPYRWTLPTADHVFLPGHRIMVQVQSSWFPLYDRNPQTYVDNIFNARVADYRAATQRVYDAGTRQSVITLPVLPVLPDDAVAETGSDLPR